MGLKEILAIDLADARQRSLDLLAPLGDADLVAQHSPIMSPLVWDLAHVGNYEEQWLLRAVAGRDPLHAHLDDVYDAFRHPRPDRPSLPLLGPAEARTYIGDVRDRVIDVLDQAAFDDDHPLLSDGFVYAMVIQHEHQHDETMVATLQLMAGTGYRPVAPPPPPGAPLPTAEVRVPAGPFVMGADDTSCAYDNERPAHVVDLDAFWIDTAPVTNAKYVDFIDDGGYSDRRLWSDEGWAWRQDEGAEHPQFWRRDEAGSWSRVRFGWQEDLPLDEPVQHVCFHEASAYARWAGRRLPTEAEWEKAASSAPAAPGGAPQANLGQQHFGPAPVGAYPAGASAYGAHQMIGDVWEWTSTDFGPYPGFQSFPYREYSEVFFASDYRVLRGGSWATHPRAARTTFRNWDHPVRRQIFAGFRCARDD
ncbi:MAG: ergothioneine biosynthesis protein EgtB [Acidimicrobiales bacterium]